MIDLVLFRCRIGIFNQKKLGKIIKSNGPQKNNVFLQMNLLFILLFQGLCVKINLFFSYCCDGFIFNCFHKFLTWQMRGQLIDHNFYARYKFGNIKRHLMKLMHWNKGSSYLKNKMDEIEAIVQQQKPHILGLSEANLLVDHDVSEVNLPEYNLHLCPTIYNRSINASRVVVYTHNSVMVTPRPDLMSNEVSAIWLEVGFPHKRKFLICNVYREWGHLNQQDKSTHTFTAQLERWKILVENWEKALQEGKEVILSGDININSLKWGKDDLPANDFIHKQKELIDLLFEKIFPYGVVQQISVPTHKNSCLDHFYTNKPEKNFIYQCMLEWWLRPQTYIFCQKCKKCRQGT